uniref:Uncharacterized protein n=1 Tax=Arundo donax TaxID=35708 RepID=A0A0A8Z9X5_ARUDO
MPRNPIAPSYKKLVESTKSKMHEHNQYMAISYQAIKKSQGPI